MINVDYTHIPTTSQSPGFGSLCRNLGLMLNRIELKKQKGTIQAKWSEDYPYQVCISGQSGLEV
jgi:hypothetical protein